MQTFITYPSFFFTARSLDSKRLNKQRVECKQIYFALTGVREFADGTTVEAKGWKNHPAVKMWKGYEAMLCQYAYFMCNECDARDFADNTNLKKFFQERMLRHEHIVPHWITDEEKLNKLIRSHRSNLIRKDASFYQPQWENIPNDIPYYWPTLD